MVAACLLGSICLLLWPGVAIAALGTVTFLMCTGILMVQRRDDVYMADSFDTSFNCFVLGTLFAFSLPYMLVHSAMFYCLDLHFLGPDSDSARLGYVFWIVELPTKFESDQDGGTSNTFIA